MNYNLTTGEMLDKLKVGEIAEGNTYWEVKRLEDGRIVERNSGDEFKMTIDFISETWRIVSNGHNDYFIGQKLVEKEDCMNNFRKDQVVTVDDVRGNEILLDGLAYIAKDFVNKYFEEV